MPNELASPLGNRRTYIGGSDARAIAAGDWLDLWKIKTGRAEPEDLSDKLPVQLGSFTEAFNRSWFEKVTRDRVAMVGQEIVHPDFAFLKGHLDGVTVTQDGNDDAIFEAKHVSPFVDEAYLMRTYGPQLQHYMLVSGYRYARLSVIFGNARWEAYQVEADDRWQADYLAQAIAFWAHVVNDTEPYAPLPIMPPAWDDMREQDMTGSNSWAAFASCYIADQPAAKRFEEAKDGLKSMVETDCRRAFGHGIEIVRSRSKDPRKPGALTVKVMEAADA